MGSSSLAADMLVLVTGVPAVGKTSVCQYMSATWPSRYLHVPFGRLLLEAISDAQVTEQSLRESPSEFVDASTIRLATETLLSVAQRTPSDVTVLVDSHAVSQDRFGYVARPDGDDYFRTVQYSAIIQLHADPAVVLQRTDVNRDGRHATTMEDLSTHFLLQAAVSMSYARASSCALYVVWAQESVESVAHTVDSILSFAA